MALTEHEPVPAVARGLRAPGLTVMKFGGTSVGDTERLKHVARRCVAASEGGSRVVAVVSAMGGMTDELLRLAHEITDNPAPREVDMLVSVGAEVCEIYTDVSGVFTADPRVVPGARKLEEVSHEEMLEMAASGAGVMATRSIEVARSHNVNLYVRSSFEETEGTWIREENE